MRVRGLKPDECGPDHPSAQSHPVRVRGLKRTSGRIQFGKSLVAPRAGAWVETDYGWSIIADEAESHPVRVRGLKRVFLILSLRSA